MNFPLAFLIVSIYLITSTFGFLIYLYHKENKIEQKIIDNIKLGTKELAEKQKIPILLIKEETVNQKEPEIKNKKEVN